MKEQATAANEATANEIRHPIGSGGRLALRNVAGRIRLTGTGGTEAVVRVRSDSGRQPRLNVERSEGSLLVEPERHGEGFLNLGINFGGGLDFDVELPRGARLDVKTVSADIDAQGLSGEQTYKTVSGAIRASALSGRISAMTVSGDVRLHDAGELELDGATTSGDVTLEARLVRQLGVRTISGDVRVVGRLQPGPRHSVETVSGDLALETSGGVATETSRALDFGKRGGGPVVVGDGSARLFFRSMSGDQRVKLVGAAAADEPASTATRLEVLRALERGEIDVDEASRRLEGVPHG
jgi:hypothetical protein